jgi:tetratricopeptide (TPR) repeat protein
MLDFQAEGQRAVLSDALGWIHALEGRFEEAEEDLARAREINPDNYYSAWVLPSALHHSGRLLQMKAAAARSEGADGKVEDLLVSADEFFQQGIRTEYSGAPDLGIPWTNPNETALKELFAERHGTIDGFEAYLAAAEDEGWEERREEILGERIQNPQPMAAFALEGLDGVEVNSESYLGQVVVVNFWGTW